MKLIPQECINERIVDVPVPQVSQETVEVVLLVLQDRIEEKVIEVPVPQIFEERICEQTEDLNPPQVVDVPVPQMTERWGQAEDSVSTQIQRRTAEYIVDVPVFKDLPQDRVEQCCVKQNVENQVDKSISQITEESVEVVKTVFREGVSERICEQGGVFEVSKISSQDQKLHDVPVPRLMEHLVRAEGRVSRQSPAPDFRAVR